MSLGCRFFSNEYPKKDDCVVVQFSRDLPHIGVYCSLLEYNGLEGMLKMSEMTRLRVSKQPHIMRQGQTEVVRVINVNPEKGFIDLSRIRDLNPMVIAETEDRWNKGKRVHSIMRNVAKATGMSAQFMYNIFAWPAAEKHGTSYAGFEALLNDPERVFEEFSIPSKFRDLLLESARTRMQPQEKIITINLELQLPTEDGIDGIISSLIAARDEAMENLKRDSGEGKALPIKIRCRRAPRYCISVTSLNEHLGKRIVCDIVRLAGKDIVSKGGRCKSSQRPVVKDVRTQQDYEDIY